MTSNNFFSTNIQLPEVFAFLHTTTGENVKGLSFRLAINDYCATKLHVLSLYFTDCKISFPTHIG